MTISIEHGDRGAHQPEHAMARKENEGTAGRSCDELNDVIACSIRKRRIVGIGDFAWHKEARLRGIVSVEGWTHHDVVPDAFGGNIADTLTPAQQEARQRSRARVTERWSETQVAVFGRIWRRWDGNPFLTETELPILEIYGDRGRPRPPRMALQLPDRPNIALQWVAGASHALPLERPGALAEAIDAFLRAPA